MNLETDDRLQHLCHNKHNYFYLNHNLINRRNNNELVAIFGNFINRVFVLTHKYYDGLVPNIDKLNEIDEQTLEKIYEFPNLISESLDDFKFRQACNILIDLSRLGNKYLADEEPWKLYKSGDLERVKQIMYVSLQACGMLAILSEPFLPKILAFQHYKTLLKRFKDFPISFSYLNRFRTKSEKDKIINELNQGTLDLIIGTHQLVNDKIYTINDFNSINIAYWPKFQHTLSIFDI